MGETLLCRLGFFLLWSLCCGYSEVSKPTVILQPSGPVVYRGEKVTLRCEIQEGGTQWMYEWRTNNGNSQRRSSEYRIDRVSDTDSGQYICMARGDHQLTGWSDAVTLTVRPDKPRAKLTADRTIIPAGGRITLSCSVDESTGWKFDWFRNDQQYSVDQFRGTSDPNSVIYVSEGGVYSCRGGRGDPVFYTGTREVTIQKRVPITPTVIQQPSWAQIYRGERVTLRCEIQDDGGTQWTYEWRPTNGNSPTSSEFMITDYSRRHYKCRGRRDSFTFTEWGFITLTVFSFPPQPVLSVSPSWLNPGASVTLSCEGLELQSAGWRFFWYKTVPHTSKSTYRFELLPGSTNGTEQNSYIINGPTHTAGFVCRAGRGEPKFYSYYSEVKFVWSADSHPAASLSVSPDRVQHFTDQSVTMKCGENDTEWRLRRFTESTRPSYVQCSNWGTMHGSSCTINKLEYHSGVYWCESGSGEFSNAVNITVQDDYYDDIILVSPVHPVTEGDPVTLSCRDKEQNLLSNVFFYHNDKLINNDSREELKISAVSKSDEGFYKCQHSGKESPRSWMSVRVTVSSPVSSSFPVMLIVGPVVGFTLGFLLLLMLCCRRSKDLWCFRSEGSSQSSTTNQGPDQRESQVYSSLLHGDASEYESIQPATLNILTGSSDDPEDDSVYSCIKTETTGKFVQLQQSMFSLKCVVMPTTLQIITSHHAGQTINWPLLQLGTSRICRIREPAKDFQGSGYLLDFH